MAATLSLILLLLKVCLSESQNESQNEIVTVTRNRDGDKYTQRTGTNGIKEITCPREKPTLGSNGMCSNDFSLRNQHCSSNVGQYFLSPESNISYLELFAIIGMDGRLKVFNELGNYENGIIIDRNVANNRSERQWDEAGCNITRMEVIPSLQQKFNINSSGFNIKVGVSTMNIQVDEASLVYPRGDYDGGLFHLNINCTHLNLDCIVLKLNGTANLCEERFEHIPECPISTITDSLPSSSVELSTITPEISTRITSFWEDPVIRNIMIGSGCGIGVLICIISILCIGICTLSVKSKSAAAIYARQMELRYNTTQDEDHYFINRSLTTSVAPNSGSPEGVTRNPENEAEEPDQEQPEDHTYASVDDAQAEVEDIRQKETTAKKFGYASITFDTFKPSMRRPPSYQPELDDENRRNRLPSFARNYNPAANRVQLARSYEVVTLMHKPSNEATNKNVSQATPDDGPVDEYDKLTHPERKLTMSQRNFSISQAEYATDYSQLSPVKKKPQQKMMLLDEATNHIPNEKPVPKRRVKLPNPMPLSSYSSVKKNSPPPLPPPYDPRFDRHGEEDHYKVPRKQKRAVSGHYDRPSSLVRVAWSCEDFGRQPPLAQALGHQAPTSIYDMPSSISPPAARKIEKEVPPELSLHSLISQDSYVDMLSTQV